MEERIVLKKDVEYYIEDSGNFEGIAVIIEVLKETCIVSRVYDDKLVIVRKSAIFHETN